MDYKIRIVSFQNAQNYGAILQAFGLMKAIENLGYEDVLFINYNPSYLRNRYKVLSKKFFDTSHFSIVTKIKYWLTLPIIIYNRIRRNVVLNKSRKHLLKQTRTQYYSVSDIRSIKCDVLICGSDQIWSTWITGKPDPVFYGYGDYIGISKKISYAASTELSSFENKDNVESIRRLLGHLDSISVREKAVQDTIQGITGRDVSLCIDPTILCGTKSFAEIANRRCVKARYILVYSYDIDDPMVNEIIRSIPSYRHYEVHYLCFGSSGLRGTLKNNIHGEVSVEDYISYFKYADYVVTNSFHGLAFSLLFEKAFNVAYKSGLSTRVESLLNQLSLNMRLVKDINEIIWEPIDYNRVNQDLESIRKESIAYLKKNLKIKK